MTNEEHKRFVETACQVTVLELQEFHPSPRYEMNGYIGVIVANAGDVRCIRLSYDYERQQLEAEFSPSAPGEVSNMTINCTGDIVPDMQPVADWL